MTPSASLIVERIDDLPLLVAQLERMGIRELLDRHFRVHGHWLGLSLGWTATLWLAHLLSEGDHRLNQVEPWAVAHLTTLRQGTGQCVDRLDLTDDRLAAVWRTLADYQPCLESRNGPVWRFDTGHPENVGLITNSGKVTTLTRQRRRQL